MASKRNDRILIATENNSEVILTRNPLTVAEQLEKHNLIADYLPPSVIQKLAADDLRAVCTGVVSLTKVTEDKKHKRLTKQELAQSLIAATEGRRNERELATKAMTIKLAQVLEGTPETKVAQDIMWTLKNANVYKAVDDLLELWQMGDSSIGRKPYTTKTIAKTLSPEVKTFLKTRALTIVDATYVDEFLKYWDTRLRPMHRSIINEGQDTRVERAFDRTQLQAAPILCWTKEVLSNVKQAGWKRVAYALGFATGRRMSEVLGERTHFVSDGESHVYFFGQNKKADDIEELWYRLPTLVDASLVITGWQYLRDNNKMLPASRVNKSHGKPLSTDISHEMRAELEAIGISKAKGTQAFKTTRDFYAACCVGWHEILGVSGYKTPAITPFIGGLLGHEKDFIATADYQKLQITDITSVECVLDERDLTQLAHYRNLPPALASLRT